jgi:hypothetical protein
MTNAPVVRRRSTAQPSSSPAAASAQELDLSQLSDAMNTRFAQAERRLAKIGVAGNILVVTVEGVDHYLDFAKEGHAWRLAQVVGDDWGGEKKPDVTPIARAPRWFRIAAAEKLGELVQEIRDSASREMERVRAALAALDRALDALGPDPDAPPDEFGDENEPF